MAVSHRNRLTLSAVVSTLCVLGAASGPRAHQVLPSSPLALAEVAALKMDPGYLRDFAISHVIQERAREGDFAGALRLMTSIGHVEERDQALLALATEQASRNPHEALETAAKIVRVEFRGQAQGEAALSFVRTGQVAMAVSTSGTIEDEGARFSSICAIATELFRDGRSDQAESLIAENVGIQLVLKNWTSTAPVQGPEGVARSMFDTKLVSFILQQKAAEPVRLEDIRASIYDYGYSIASVMQFGEIAGLRDRIGDRTSSERLIRAFVDSLGPEDDRDLAYSQMGVGMALTGDEDGALRLATNCARAETRDLVYLAVVTERSQAGDVARADAAMRLISTQPAKLGGFCELARLLAPKVPNRAAEYLKSAEKDAATSGASDPGHFYIGSMISAYAALGRRAEAQKWMARLEKEFAGKPSYEPKEMVDLYLLIGDVNSASRWAAADVQLFADVLKYQIDRHDLAGATATAAIAHSVMTLEVAHRGPSESITAVCRAEARLLEHSLLTAWIRSLPTPEAQSYAWVGVAQGLYDRQIRSGDTRPVPTMCVR